MAGSPGSSRTPCGTITHPEVLGVHVQLVAVQLGQMGKGVLDAVQVLHGIPEGGEHLLAVGTDHGVASDGSGAGEVAEGSEEPLGPGVDDEHTAFGHVDLAPKAADELLLLGCPLHHGVGWRVACNCREVRRKSRLSLPRGLPAGRRLSPAPLLYAPLGPSSAPSTPSIGCMRGAPGTPREGTRRQGGTRGTVPNATSATTHGLFCGVCPPQTLSTAPYHYTAPQDPPEIQGLG
uniref:Uncharacterized protein n=1 Tax=Nothoprocta perdicaria TaxID=30464 RepID=A0A8C6ZTV6_NOTPE